MRVKILTNFNPVYFVGANEARTMVWDGVEFTCDPDCREYDWLVVYDELHRNHPVEELACPASHTILVTQEPVRIKVQARCYTRQFHYMLTTLDPKVVRHPGYRRAAGAIVWLNNRAPLENRACHEYAKDRVLSAVFSSKRQTHTLHAQRMAFLEYIEQRMPELERFGWSICRLEHKYEALDAYRYHIAIENYCQPYHWTEKLSDPILSLSLPFYAGDPKIAQILPPDCFIPIPLGDPPAALEIMRKAIDGNEYEKRLPALREARRLLCERYNLWSQVLQVIGEHELHPDARPEPKRTHIRERHQLRRNPLNLLSEGLELARVRWLMGL